MGKPYRIGVVVEDDIEYIIEEKDVDAVKSVLCECYNSEKDRICKVRGNIKNKAESLAEKLREVKEYTLDLDREYNEMVVKECYRGKTFEYIRDDILTDVKGEEIFEIVKRYDIDPHGMDDIDPHGMDPQELIRKVICSYTKLLKLTENTNLDIEILDSHKYKIMSVYGLYNYIDRYNTYHNV